MGNNRLYLGLVHYPVYNRNKELVASAVTNLDIHDLSRLAATYSVPGFYVITPVEDQSELAKRLIRHWTQGYGAQVNPDRKKALEHARVVDSLETACEDIEDREGKRPHLILTGATSRSPHVSYAAMREMVRARGPWLLLFGTAWGLAREGLPDECVTLEPIPGLNGYNHLSVRSAAAIITDRLLGVDR